MKKRRLKTMEDVRRALADLYNRLDNDDIEPVKAGKLAYIAQVLARVIENGTLEKRLADLENKIEQLTVTNRQG